mmetsp:Transcript_17273/g.40112  ORF Transcript_17273/g.40112 Transcript_17273/m.40112 type:complete len:133 (-) Transcript_17273:13-411(-)
MSEMVTVDGHLCKGTSSTINNGNPSSSSSSSSGSSNIAGLLNTEAGLTTNINTTMATNSAHPTTPLNSSSSSSAKDSASATKCMEDTMRIMPEVLLRVNSARAQVRTPCKVYAHSSRVHCANNENLGMEGSS